MTRLWASAELASGEEHSDRAGEDAPTLVSHTSNATVYQKVKFLVLGCMPKAILHVTQGDGQGCSKTARH